MACSMLGPTTVSLLHVLGASLGNEWIIIVASWNAPNMIPFLNWKIRESQINYNYRARNTIVQQGPNNDPTTTQQLPNNYPTTTPHFLRCCCMLYKDLYIYFIKDVIYHVRPPSGGSAEALAYIVLKPKRNKHRFARVVVGVVVA